MAGAEDKSLTVSTSLDKLITSGVTVDAEYKLPADNPFATISDTLAQPHTTIWMWGDGTKDKPIVTVADYGAKVSHTYKKPGTYGVMIIVMDVKRRNIIQQSFTVKINLPVEIE